MEIYDSSFFVPLTALAVPAILTATALLSPRRAQLASTAAAGTALLFAIFAALHNGAAGASLTPLFGVRVDAATAVMLMLITSLGVVIVRYSKTYLDGELGLTRYRRYLLLTLAAVSLLAQSNHLVVIMLSWSATSIALHQLLTFFATRPAALVAAHKKFLVSRLADVCLIVSLGLVHASVGSFELDRIDAWVAAQATLPSSMHIAAVFLVLAVALKSAQLPFHGWIIQVMEAPTPVSALLHAGAVNIGGFVLIRLAPWIEQAGPARLLLVLIGASSAIAAALIMTTRVSVKVALAWSTCAQMGFMLVQCGLGLWPLALLHLVAHSLYKAHAFLSAGATVDDWKLKTFSFRAAAVSPLAAMTSALAAVVVPVLSVAFYRAHVGLPLWSEPPAFGLAILVGFSLLPLLTVRAARGIRAGAATAVRISGFTMLYLSWHILAEQVVPVQQAASNAAGWWIAAVAFGTLFAVKTSLALAPTGRFARWLHPWLFSGLYLDEFFTRLTFRLWPPHVSPSPQRVSRSLSSTSALGVHV
ncbi:MAG: NADH-quinone oxidoreductase subunit L [Myxococcaceae bacterium]